VYLISFAVFNTLLAVPVIVVFTKIDRLQFKEQRRIKKLHIENGLNAKAATARAKIECVAAAAAEYEKCCVQILKSDLIPPAWMEYCAVSNKR
jgi:GTP-binding protein EngB required for normal cell division